MKAYRIEISTWTSSFRYPNVISGFQPTLTVPPISTVLGLINACAGKYIKHNQLNIGYYFDFKAKCVDLETIYQFELDKKSVKNQVKSNIINREFLFECRLILYVTDKDIADYFIKPQYQILLGRSNDIASINSIKEIELNQIDSANKIKGQIIPFKGNGLPGVIQALPKYFTDTIPRKNLGTEAYSVIQFNSSDYPTALTAYRDKIDDNEIDIYFHNLSF